MQIDQIEEQATTKKKKTEIHPTNLVPKMPLINRNNDCFVNSIIQSINELTDFHDYLHNLNIDSEFYKELKNILYHNQNTVAKLKKIIGGRFDDGNQQCAYDFWKEMFNNFEMEFQQKFQFVKYDTARCIRLHRHICNIFTNEVCNCNTTPGCGRQSQLPLDLKEELFLQPTNGPQQFKFLINKSSTSSVTKACATCSFNTEHDITSRIEFPPEFKYLVIQINRFLINQHINLEERIKCDIRNFS